MPIVVAIAVSLALVCVVAQGAEGQPATEAVEIPTPEYLRLMMARDRAVHAELKLDGLQREKLRAAVVEVDQPFWRLRDVPPAKSAKELEMLAVQLRQRMDQTLSREQQARFEQLVLQARGARALTKPDLRRQLGLNGDQSKQISELIATSKAGSLPATTLLAILNDEQQAKLSALFGPRFDLSQVTRIGCFAPELQGVEAWINTSPLTLEAQRGKVVVVHFWAFGCINCIRNLPHYDAWRRQFSTDDLTIIGIHTPETVEERDLAKLRTNVAERGIKYPVAFDRKGENWNAWANNLWPSVYLIDRQGQVRSWWYGELNWQGATGEQQMRENIAALINQRPMTEK